MSSSDCIFRRVAFLLPLFCALTCMATSAATIYNVSGTFQPSGPSNPDTGPLNGGRFGGTFSATLPVPAVGESFASFNINLYSSSGAVLANLSSAAGDIGGATLETSDCGISSTATGPCDRFFWGSTDGNTVLQLVAVPGFTGGATYPYFFQGLFGSLALLGGPGLNQSSLVATGSITPVPEPGSFVLLGFAAFLTAGVSRKLRRQ